MARFLRGLTTKAAPTERLEILNINGDPGLASSTGDEPTGVVTFTTSDPPHHPSRHHPRAGKATPPHVSTPVAPCVRSQICLRRGRHGRSATLRTYQQHGLDGRIVLAPRPFGIVDGGVITIGDDAVGSS